MGQVAGIALMWFIIELLLWYAVGKTTSGWYVFFWFIIAFVIGMGLVRKGMATLNPMAKQMQAGGMGSMMNPSMRPNEDSMMKTVATSLAGVLLLIPGLMSDFLALIVLLPPVQKKLKKMGNDYVMNNQEKMMEMMMKQMGGQGGQNPFGNMGGMNGQNPFGGMGGMNGQNPFGGMGGTNGQNPFGGMGGNNPFGNFGNQAKNTTTVDGTAKPVQKDVKKLTSANDD